MTQTVPVQDELEDRAEAHTIKLLQRIKRIVEAVGLPIEAMGFVAQAYETQLHGVLEHETVEVEEPSKVSPLTSEEIEALYQEHIKDKNMTVNEAREVYNKAWKDKNPGIEPPWAALPAPTL